MTRWIDCRNYLPPRGMTVLCYLRDKIELFGDRMVSATCNYSVTTDSDGFKTVDILSRSWSIIEVNQQWKPEESQELLWEDQETFTEISHWTLIPDKSSNTWVDIYKFPPSPFMDHLIYMRDKGEDRNDFIIGGSYHITNSIKDLDRSKLRYEPVYWSLMPQVPRLIDDTFAC